MRPARQTIRFFRVIRPVPRLTRFAFACLTVVSAMALWPAHEGETGALLPVLVLQMFTVATGFIRDARRGHFDVLLTSGVTRGEAAMVYWALAALPGIACWLILAAFDLATHGHTALLHAGSFAALAVVSTIPWAITVPLSRFTGAIAWLLALVIVLGLPSMGEATAQIWVRGNGEPSGFATLAFLVFPARLVGQRLEDDVWPILSVGVLALFGMCSALAWISRTDVALETGQ